MNVRRGGGNIKKQVRYTVRRGDSGHVGRIGTKFHSLEGCRWKDFFNWGYQGMGNTRNSCWNGTFISILFSWGTPCTPRMSQAALSVIVVVIIVVGVIVVGVIVVVFVLVSFNFRDFFQEFDRTGESEESKMFDQEPEQSESDSGRAKTKVSREPVELEVRLRLTHHTYSKCYLWHQLWRILLTGDWWQLIKNKGFAKKENVTSGHYS